MFRDKGWESENDGRRKQQKKQLTEGLIIAATPVKWR